MEHLTVEKYLFVCIIFIIFVFIKLAQNMGKVL